MRDAAAADSRLSRFTGTLLRLAAGVVMFAGLVAVAPQAMALSVLGDAPAQQNQEAERHKGEVLEALEATTLPQPAPAIDRPAAAPKETPKVPAAPAPTAPAASPSGGSATAPKADAADDEAEIIRDLSTLPTPVRKAREQIVEAAASGDIERLRPLMQHGADRAQVMNGEDKEDPIDTLKEFSGDPDGQEILAIILDLLSTSVARFDAGTPQEMYVWPYFAGKPLDKLAPPERVELLRIVTAGDLAGMQENGSYNFYRMGISPDGHWKYIVGGD